MGGNSFVRLVIEYMREVDDSISSFVITFLFGDVGLVFEDELAASGVRLCCRGVDNLKSRSEILYSW